MADQSAENPNKARNQVFAILLMVLVAFLSALDSVLVRFLTGELHPFVIAFFRALFGLVAILPWIAMRPGILRSEYRIAHVIRAALKLCGIIAFIFAIAAAPLADVTAIAFTSPILVAIGAWLFLGENPTARRFAGIAMGFAGVLIILQPGNEGVNIALGYALISAMFIATIHLMLKRMSGRDKTETLVAWNLIVTVPLAAIPALLVWTPPSIPMLGLLALQGAIGALNMTILTKSISLADVSVTNPVDFLRLPFVAILAFAIFHETVGLSTWVGGIVIFAATLVLANDAGRRPKQGEHI